mgnify:CR=1 FL=1
MVNCLYQYILVFLLLGITSETINLAETDSQEKLLRLIEEKNEDKSVDGILVQLPVPAHIR